MTDTSPSERTSLMTMIHDEEETKQLTERVWQSSGEATQEVTHDDDLYSSWSGRGNGRRKKDFYKKRLKTTEDGMEGRLQRRSKKISPEA